MALFDEKIEIREQCRGVLCVDLGESIQTHIFLQKLASIQPRTSPVKFARPSNAAVGGCQQALVFQSPVDSREAPGEPEAEEDVHGVRAGDVPDGVVRGLVHLGGLLRPQVSSFGLKLRVK